MDLRLNIIKYNIVKLLIIYVYCVLFVLIRELVLVWMMLIKLVFEEFRWIFEFVFLKVGFVGFSFYKKKNRIFNKFYVYELF